MTRLPTGFRLRPVVIALALCVVAAAACSSHPAPNKDGSVDGATSDGASTDGSGAPCMSDGPGQALGASCTGDCQCQSGFCADGVCCSSACTGGCNTCAAPGLVGTCTKLAAGAAPRNVSDCPTQGAAACGLDGLCDGAGMCRVSPPGTSCEGASTALPVCNGDEVMGGGACDGNGQCVGAVATVCVPYTCDTTTNACVTACSATAQCTGAQACDFATGSCGPIPGGHCTKDADCQSGFCADSVCCNVACDGPCVSCSIPGRLGTCWPIDAGKGDPRGICKDMGALNCGHDGTCDGVGGCANYAQTIQCLAPSCTGDRLNTPASCNGLGSCLTTSSGVLNCHPFLCAPAANGRPAACTNTCKVDADCDPPAACTNGSCGPKPLGHVCAASSECASSQCVDGVCCDSTCTGACRSCNLTSSPGHCTLVAAGATKDPRGICTDKGAPSCGNNGTCDGSGGCAHYAAGTTCAGETCASGIYTPPSTCSANSLCVAPDSRACIPYACNGTQCFSVCSTNAQCASTYSCGTKNTCGLLNPGASCTTAAQCLSGFCAQGICCNSACTGACQSCALTTSLGTCTSVAVGAADPQNTCKDAGAASCGNNGHCDGKGACQKYLAGTTCIGASCAAATAVATPASTCDGAGKCMTPASHPCYPYLCGANACKSSCTPATSATDCKAPASCSSTTNSCGLKGIGQACASGTECLSSFCAQGFCCSSACTGACQSCAISLGTCTNVANGNPDPQGTCHAAGNDTCGMDGFCNGAGACRLYAAGSSCAAPTCPTGGSTLTSGRTCNGAGVCQAATTSSCAPYVCNGATACYSACSADAQCLSPEICDPMTQLCGNKKRLGQSCTATSDCLTGEFCTDGVCCGAASCGTCKACNVTGSLGTCANLANGAPAPTGQCATSTTAPCGNTGSCNGLGACQQQVAGTQCAGATCSGSTPTLFAPSTCNGTGTCVAPTTGTPCSPYACGTVACKTICTANTDCVAPYTCQGGSCLKKPDGQTCATSNECQNNSCISGICCNSMSCATTTTNPCGNTGTCSTGKCDQAAPTKSCGLPESCTGTTHQPPSFCSGAGTCTQTMAASCSPFTCSGTACAGTCSGVNAGCATGQFCVHGACIPPNNGATCSAGTDCSSGFCVDGVCCNSACAGACQACNLTGSVGTCSTTTGASCPVTPTCSGSVLTLATGMCSSGATCTPSTQNCSPYACKTTGCPTTCGTTADCASGFFCVGGSCIAPNNGAVCGTDSTKCTSGNCVDGVCCNTACAGACQACNLSGSMGTCSTTTGASCSVTPMCSGSVLTPATGSCSSGAVCTPSTQNCSPYACKTTGCPTTCGTTADCASGFFCVGGSCIAPNNGAICGGDGQCSSGHCVDGVCCSTSACGACLACNVNGVGTCAPRPAGAAPSCPIQGAASCGTNGCDGSGNCQVYSSSTVCAVASCSSDGFTFTAASNCDGLGDGMCGPGVTQMCMTSCDPTLGCQ